MKEGIKSTEFYTMLVATLISVAVALRIVKPEAQGDLSVAVNNIITMVATIAPAISYIISRTWLKAKTSQELKNGSTQPSA